MAMMAVAGYCEVKLPSVLSDGVVLQRQQPITIWGTAEPGESVNVTLAGKKGNAVAGADGKWEVSLPAIKAGGPYTLTANDKKVDDVLIGDLYLCSGQSNMELPVSRVMDMFRDDVNAYSNERIREFKTPKEYAFHGPQADVKPTRWKKVRPEEVGQFGALVYFIARELYEQNGGVPVGIVNSSWGGSKIETWISEEGLADYPLRLNRLRMVEDDQYRDLLGKAENRIRYVWDRTLNSQDAGYGSQPYKNGKLGGSATAVELLGNWGDDSEGKAINGSHWLSKDVEVSAAQAAGDATLRMGCIVDADSVWVNGKFVGWTAYQYPPRIYRLPKGTLHEGKNNVTVRVVSQNGKPHMVNEKPYKIVFDDTAVGEVDLNGEWNHVVGARMPQAPGVTDFFQSPTVLYNGLIAPMTKFPFKGVVWYQGESDVDIRKEYKNMMKSLIADWRVKTGNESLPFYIVELADFLHPSDTGGRAAWQEMRDAQRMAAEETADAYWIRNGDIGEWNDIHPLDKRTPARRVVEAMRKHEGK